MTGQNPGHRHGVDLQFQTQWSALLSILLSFSFLTSKGLQFSLSGAFFFFHFLTLKMSNFQAVMLPANTFQLPPLWFFIVYRALSGHQEDWGTVTLFSR